MSNTVPTLAEIYKARDNILNVDSFVNLTTDTFVDTDGVTKQTLTGLIANIGFTDSGLAFGDVGQIDAKNELVFNNADDFFYQYTGLSSLPVAIPASPSVDWLKFLGNNHEFLTNFGAVGGHDAIYSRQFNTIAAMQAGSTSALTLNCSTTGAISSNDGGGASWFRSGVTGTPNTISAATGTVFNALGDGFQYSFNNYTAKKEVDPTHFALATDGTTNHTNAFNALLTFADVLRIPSTGLGLAVSGVVVGAGKSIIGNGYTSGIKALDGANATAITLHEKATMKGLRIFATGGKASGLTLQVGIAVVNRYRTICTELFFDGLGGSAYLNKDTVAQHQGNTFTNYVIDNCNIGVNADSQGEYLNASGGSVTECNTAFRVQAGNLNCTGTVVSNNDIGIDLVAGANDAHGQITGMLLNHNVTRTIRAVDLANGFTFIGMQMFNGGAIELKNVNGINFRGGVKSLVNVIEDGCTNCRFTQYELTGQIGNTPNANGNASEVFYIDCDVKGVSPSSFDAFNGGLLRTSQTTNQVAIGALVDFVFDTVDTNAIPGNTAYTIQNFYNSGVITAGSSKVRPDSSVKINAVISLGRDDLAVFDPKLIAISLQSTVTGKKFGFFSVVDAAPIGGTNFVRYAFNGTVTRENCKIVIDSSVPAGITVYADESAALVQTTMEVTGW